MEWNIPGTVLRAPVDAADQVQAQLESMFLGGGIVLSQVVAVTGMESHTVQNWVKRGFLSKPEGKKYTLRQLCRIIIINMLKDTLRMEEICGLMTYINGQLDDESDDRIDDSRLYFLFLRLAARHRGMHDPAGRDACIAQALADYEEPAPGTRERVEKVLKVMLTAWAAALLRQQAMSMVAALKKD